ncbi:MAG: flagellar motor protein MotD [Gammaproteobacteria bacterium]|nr:flagellar motor protein MotD [Gammaproteobacteria bacterium]MDH5735456.1 flagellar motor protein MotD [Gammaproteobacteria bacterium]
MSRRRYIEQDEENTSRWLVSYADFITLLFAFFVVMYSISSVNIGKYRVLSDSVSLAFLPKETPKEAEVVTAISAPRTPFSIGIDGRSSYQAMADTAAKIEKRLKKLINQGQIALRGNEKWLEIELKSSILFDSGSAELGADASQVLEELSQIFQDSNNPLYVSGYTDNVPISTPKYSSNWELSAARAASVVKLFAETGVNPERMGAIGFGEFRPVVDNDTPDNRIKNRRVVIRLIAGSDMFSSRTPFADRAAKASVSEKSAQSLQVESLQPGEPARAFQ